MRGWARNHPFSKAWAGPQGAFRGQGGPVTGAKGWANPKGAVLGQGGPAPGANEWAGVCPYSLVDPSPIHIPMQKKHATRIHPARIPFGSSPPTKALERYPDSPIVRARGPRPEARGLGPGARGPRPGPVGSGQEVGRPTRGPQEPIESASKKKCPSAPRRH